MGHRQNQEAMTTYSVKAPNGIEYEIDGPEGATEEMVRSRVLAAHPEASGKREPDAFDKALIAGGGFSGLETGPTNAFIGMGKRMSDWGLGAQQAAADIGFGDKKALAAEAADRERRDKPLM